MQIKQNNSTEQIEQYEIEYHSDIQLQYHYYCVSEDKMHVYNNDEHYWEFVENLYYNDLENSK